MDGDKGPAARGADHLGAAPDLEAGARGEGMDVAATDDRAVGGDRRDDEQDRDRGRDDEEDEEAAHGDAPPGVTRVMGRSSRIAPSPSTIQPAEKVSRRAAIATETAGSHGIGIRPNAGGITIRSSTADAPSSAEPARNTDPDRQPASANRPDPRTSVMMPRNQQSQPARPAKTLASWFTAISRAPTIVATAPTAGTMNAARTRRGWRLDWKALRPTRAIRSRTVRRGTTRARRRSLAVVGVEMASPANQAMPPNTAARPPIRKVMTNPFAWSVAAERPRRFRWASNAASRMSATSNGPRGRSSRSASNSSPYRARHGAGKSPSRRRLTAVPAQGA